MMTNLLSITSGVRQEAGSDWPVAFTLSAEIDGIADTDIVFIYDPNDPYGDLNPQIAAWLLSHPEFVIADYEPPAPPPTPVPSDFTLTKRQIMRALIISGTTMDPDAFIATACGAIVDPTNRALALTDWQTAPFYTRSHPLFNDADMLAAVSMTSNDIDTLWMLAKDQPA